MKRLLLADMTARQKRAFIPNNPLPQVPELLASLGRGVSKLAPKLTVLTSQQLLQSDSQQLEALGVGCRDRKHLLRGLYQLKTGQLVPCEVNARQKKYLAVKAKVDLLRLQKLGMV